MRRIGSRFSLLFCIVFLLGFAPENAHADSLHVSASATAVSSSKIKLQWNGVALAGSYAVYRKTSADAAYQKVITTSNTDYTDAKVKAAVNYYYKIVPVSRETGKEIKTAEVSVKMKTPASTSIEKVKVKSPTKIQLFWKASAGSDGYQIFRSEGDGARYTEVEYISGKTACTYTDANVIPGKTYFYKIRPVNRGNGGFGSCSAPVRGRTIAQASIASISSLASNRMQITWNQVKNARAYEIYRSTQAKGGYKKITTLKGAQRKYVDKTVKSGKKYYYKIVVAGSFNGEKITSGYSEAVSYRALKQVKISSVKVTANDGLKLKWNKVTGASKYKIYRASSKFGTYKKIATVKSAEGLAYTDNKVVSGRTYYYKVQAYSDGKGLITAGSGTRSDAKGASLSYAIMGETSVTKEQMAALYNASGKKYPSNIYKSKGAKNIKEFCKIVLDESEKEGVKAEVIFAQICLETGYLSFGGQVSAQQCNFSGIGATDDGAAGATFSDVRTGVRAQVQHLKGYASKEDLNQKCVDPRFMYLSSKRGIAKYVQNLGNGNWATDPGYAFKLMGLIRSMKSY